MRTRYFYDTEFLEDGRTIELISIGIVADDGREFYAVNEAVQADDKLHRKIVNNPWLMKNVVASLPLGKRPTLGLGAMFKLDMDSNAVMPLRMIRNGVREFLQASRYSTELWADYGAYDHVALAQLFGPMVNLPDGVPMYTNEFQQAWRACGSPELPKQEEGLHNALEDARHLKRCFDVLSGMTWGLPEMAAASALEGRWERVGAILDMLTQSELETFDGNLDRLKERVQAQLEP